MIKINGGLVVVIKDDFKVAKVLTMCSLCRIKVEQVSVQE